MPSISDFSATRLLGGEEALSIYAGKVVLVVNVASKCGLTPQYEGLEKLYRDYGDKGLVILGFPCNQFAGQEPGTSAEIAQFCSLTYDVTFPIFAKVDVNGPNTHPIFAALKVAAPNAAGGEDIEWNFNKFLLDRSGKVIARFAPQTEPASLAGDIEKLL